jgi:hypothetical protein
MSMVDSPGGLWAGENESFALICGRSGKRSVAIHHFQPKAHADTGPLTRLSTRLGDKTL